MKELVTSVFDIYVYRCYCGNECVIFCKEYCDSNKCCKECRKYKWLDEL